LLATASVASFVAAAPAPEANSTAAVSVTRLTAARTTPGDAVRTFCTAAEHPPQRIPSTENSTVVVGASSSSVSDAAVADEGAAVISLSVVSPARARVNRDRDDRPPRTCPHGV
jgi:hypothetical protein